MIRYAVRAAVRDAETPWLTKARSAKNDYTWTASAWQAMTFATPQEALAQLEEWKVDDYCGGYSPLEIVSLVEEFTEECGA